MALLVLTAGGAVAGGFLGGFAYGFLGATGSLATWSSVGGAIGAAAGSSIYHSLQTINATPTLDDLAVFSPSESAGQETPA